MINENIISIGVELEGGINYNELDSALIYLHQNELLTFFEEGYDGSVGIVGKEIRSGEFSFWNTEKENMFKFLNTMYDHGFITNESCGFHVHVKFTNPDKMVGIFSMRKAQNWFIKKYIDKFSKNEKYMKRLNNRYCNRRYYEFKIANQLSSKDSKAGERYTAINLNAYPLYGTIEFRIFPHQECKGEATGLINWLIQTLDEMVKTFDNECLFKCSMDLVKTKSSGTPIETILFDNLPDDGTIYTGDDGVWYPNLDDEGN